MNAETIDDIIEDSNCHVTENQPYYRCTVSNIIHNRVYNNIIRQCKKELSRVNREREKLPSPIFTEENLDDRETSLNIVINILTNEYITADNEFSLDVIISAVQKGHTIKKLQSTVSRLQSEKDDANLYNKRKLQSQILILEQIMEEL